ncbi:MAG: hypothetical protein RL557_379 [archaeon]|jgi:predicted metallopeptidase
MPIRYEIAPDIMEEVNELATLLFPHVRLDSVSCIRSFGSLSPRTIARCHALGKAMQLGMGRRKGFYVIEVLSRRFDKLAEEEKTKVLIHELMHIPKSFGGGFRHHDYVCEKNIEREYQRYTNLKKQQLFSERFSEKKEMENRHEKKEIVSEVYHPGEKKRWFW